MENKILKHSSIVKKLMDMNLKRSKSKSPRARPVVSLSDPAKTPLTKHHEKNQYNSLEVTQKLGDALKGNQLEEFKKLRIDFKEIIQKQHKDNTDLRLEVASLHTTILLLKESNQKLKSDMTLYQNLQRTYKDLASQYENVCKRLKDLDKHIAQLLKENNFLAHENHKLRSVNQLVLKNQKMDDLRRRTMSDDRIDEKPGTWLGRHLKKLGSEFPALLMQARMVEAALAYNSISEEFSGYGGLMMRNRSIGGRRAPNGGGYGHGQSFSAQKRDLGEFKEVLSGVTDFRHYGVGGRLGGTEEDVRVTGSGKKPRRGALNAAGGGNGGQSFYNFPPRESLPFDFPGNMMGGQRRGSINGRSLQARPGYMPELDGTEKDQLLETTYDIREEQEAEEAKTNHYGDRSHRFNIKTTQFGKSSSKILVKSADKLQKKLRLKKVSEEKKSWGSMRTMPWKQRYSKLKQLDLDKAKKKSKLVKNELKRFRERLIKKRHSRNKKVKQSAKKSRKNSARAKKGFLKVRNRLDVNLTNRLAATNRELSGRPRPQNLTMLTTTRWSRGDSVTTSTDSPNEDTRRLRSKLVEIYRNLSKSGERSVKGVGKESSFTLNVSKTARFPKMEIRVVNNEASGKRLKIKPKSPKGALASLLKSSKYAEGSRLAMASLNKSALFISKNGKIQMKRADTEENDDTGEVLEVQEEPQTPQKVEKDLDCSEEADQHLGSSEFF